MSQKRYIQYFKYGWDLIDREEILKFARKQPKQRKQLKILSYGCNLDYKSIQQLKNEYFLSGNQGEINDTIEICLDTYDANLENFIDDWIFPLNINENRLIEFENELHKLPGKHVRCHYNVRGHFEVQLDGKEFSTRVQKTLDCSAIYKEAIVGRYIFFIDQESENNEEIRSKIHLLPESLQSLSIPVNFSQTQKEVYVRDWIRRIIAY